jgi:hypothetical protein
MRALQRAPELFRSSRAPSSERALQLVCCSSGEAPKLACLFKQKKKVSILPNRGRVGLVVARASTPTPQQQFHSISSTATALELELPLHKSSSGDGVRGGEWGL